MSAKYAIAKDVDGWSILDATTAEVVVIGSIIQNGLLGALADHIAKRLNEVGDPRLLAESEVRSLLSGRPEVQHRPGLGRS